MQPSDEPEDEQFDVVLDDVETGIRPRKLKPADTKKRQSGSGWQFASLAGQVGLEIAMPMVLGLIAGTKLDEHWGTRPKATLLLFSVGLILGCTSLIRIVRDGIGKG